MDEEAGPDPIATLDELAEEGKIEHGTAAVFADKTSKLVEALRQYKKHEAALYDHASELSNAVHESRQQVEVHHASEFNPACDNAELLSEKLRASEEILGVVTRQQDMLDRMDMLEEEGHSLRAQLAALGAGLGGKVDPELLQLDRKCKLLQDKMQELQIEKEQLGLDKAERARQLDKSHADLSGAKTSLSDANAQIEGLDNRLPLLERQNGLFQASLASQTAEAEKKAEQIGALQKELASLKQSRAKEETQLVSEEREIVRLTQVLHEIQHQTDDEWVKLEGAKDEHLSLIGDRSLLHSTMKQLGRDAKLLLQQRARLGRERDKAAKELRQSQAKVDATEHLITSLVSGRDERQDKLTEYKKQLSRMSNLLPKVKHEVEGLERQFISSQGKGSLLTAQVNKSISELRKLEKKVADQQITGQKQARTIDKLQNDVSRVASEHLRAKSEAKQALSKLAEHEAIVSETNKAVGQLEGSVQNVQKVARAINNDKNQCLAQINLTQQRAAELRTKMRVLETEKTVLQATVEEKRAKLERIEADCDASTAALDAVKQDVNHARANMRDLEGQQKNMDGEHSRLLDIINRLEKDAVKFRKEQENMATKRNETAERLLELQRYISAQYAELGALAMAERTAEQSLREREEDLRALRLQRTDYERRIANHRQYAPLVPKLEQDLISAQLELLSYRKRIAKLEEALQHPEKTSRWKQLDGADQSKEELAAKIVDLQAKLRQTEDKILEKDFMIDETTKLMRRAENQLQKSASSASQADLVAATTDAKLKLKGLETKIKALTSELAMYQGQLFQLESSHEELQQAVQEGRERLANQQAPTDAAEQEWARRQRMETQRQRESQRLQETTSGNSSLRRPNAYVPDVEGGLPIPKPFIAPPFMPQEAPAHVKRMMAVTSRKNQQHAPETLVRSSISTTTTAQ